MSPQHLQTLKWAAMAAALFWTVLYRMAERTSELPEFVYVNF